MKLLFLSGFAVYLNEEEVSSVDIEEEIVTVTAPSGRIKRIRAPKSLIMKPDSDGSVKGVNLVERATNSGSQLLQNLPKHLSNQLSVTNEQKNQNDVDGIMNVEIMTKSPSDSALIEQKLIQNSAIGKEIEKLKKMIDEVYQGSNCDHKIWKKVQEIRTCLDSKPEVLSQMPEQLYADFCFKEGIVKGIVDSGFFSDRDEKTKWEGRKRKGKKRC